MEEVLVPILTSLGFFAAIFGILYMHYTTRNRERMALIEKGESAEIFKKKDDNRKSNLKYGMLGVGAAIGILLGNAIDTYTAMEEEVAFFSMIFLWGGLALIAFYLFTKDEESGKSDQKKEA